MEHFGKIHDGLVQIHGTAVQCHGCHAVQCIEQEMMIDLKICHGILCFLKIPHKCFVDFFTGRDLHFFFHEAFAELFEFAVVPDRLEDSFHQCLDSYDNALRNIVNFFYTSSFAAVMSDIAAFYIP